MLTMVEIAPMRIYVWQRMFKNLFFNLSLSFEDYFKLQLQTISMRVRWWIKNVVAMGNDDHNLFLY